MAWQLRVSGAYRSAGMKELYQSNNIVELSCLQAALSEEGIDSFVLDQHMSVLEGSLGALPRRLMVNEKDEARAKKVIDMVLLSVGNGPADGPGEF